MTDITSQVKNYTGSNSFVLKMKDAISKYGSLTVNQKSAVERIFKNVEEVKNGVFPSSENFYEIKEDELEKLLGDDKWKYEKDRVENNAVPNHSVTPITSKPSEIKR